MTSASTTHVSSAQMKQSPLHHHASHTNASDAGLVMKEDKFRGHLNLRGNPLDVAFNSAVEHVLGVTLPTKANTSHRKGDTVVYWLCPNEWLVMVVSGTQGHVEADLRLAMGDQHVAITDVSSGQTLVNLSGIHLAEVLQKSTVYDCHPDNFPVGKVVQTTFAKTGTTLCKLDDGSMDLIIRRSFADYFFLWLQDASEEYGLKIV